jgi:hypothetical protein
MLFGNPARLADHDHTVTRLERVPSYTLAAQESASTPFDIPYLHRPFFIGSLHVQERVWIAEEKLNDFPFDLLSLTFQIGRSERMVSGDRTRGKGEYNGKSRRGTNKMLHIGFRLGRIVLKDKCEAKSENPEGLRIYEDLRPLTRRCRAALSRRETVYTAASDGRFLSR